MKRYTIRTTVTATIDLPVIAESEDEAREQAQDMISEHKIPFDNLNFDIADTDCMKSEDIESIDQLIAAAIDHLKNDFDPDEYISSANNPSYCTMKDSFWNGQCVGEEAVYVQAESYSLDGDDDIEITDSDDDTESIYNLTLDDQLTVLKDILKS